MAEVFVAVRTGPHGFRKRVAFKRILPRYARDPDFVSMFVGEARLAARLEHTNIVHVFDFGELEGQLFLTMELVEGTNVSRMVRSVSSRAEAVPLEVALSICAETAHALAYAHELAQDNGEPLQVVHRDVSPANILLTSTGHVKLTDFGIAKCALREGVTEEGHVRGKLGYMSPEQVMGKELAGASDVFTLSTVLAEMLIAEPLFGGGVELDALIKIRNVDLTRLYASERHLPKDVLRLVEKGLARDPVDRLSARAFARGCEEIIRRRGLEHGPAQVVRLGRRLQLFETHNEDPACESGSGVNSFADTTGITVRSEKMADDFRIDTPLTYRIRFKDGEEVGPLSYSRLIQEILAGRVAQSTLVSRSEHPFSPASEVPELGRIVNSKALLFGLDDLSHADRSGSLGRAALLQAVHRITHQYETGVLHLWHGVRRKKIYFVEGRPDFVASTEKSELLGEFLAHTGWCLRMEVDMALAMMPRYGGRLGDALVGLGILRPVQLYRAVAAQVRERYLDAFRWRQGRYAFVSGIRAEEETFPLGYSVHELLRDAVQYADIDELKAALQGFRMQVIHRSVQPPTSIEAYRLPESWERLVTAVRGDATLEAFVERETRARDMELDQMYRALFLGLCCELIDVA